MGFTAGLLCSHVWPLVMDLKRLRDVYLHLNICPLGSGALAGNPFSIDRESMAKELGFQSSTMNSLQAVSDRDFVGECNSHLQTLCSLVQFSNTFQCCSKKSTTVVM